MARRKKVSAVQPLLLSIPEVAIQLGVCRQTVYNLMYYKGLPSIQLGGIRRIHPESLQKWLKECQEPHSWS
jgi:excisionase family DNA binding protein